MKAKFTTALFLILLLRLPLAAQHEGLPVKDFQLSIIPHIGTDGGDSPHYQYRASINIFAGITGGIDGVELGGFLNMTNGTMRGVQLSGFGNLVRGQVSGFQGAGFFNMNSGDANAFKGSGFLNLTSGSFEGFQGAGFANITGGYFQGFAGAGFANISGGNAQGFAGAGFANISGGNAQGFAGAGFANVSGGTAQGFLAAGFANISGGGASGFQAAGFANLSGGDVDGPQFAGFMNAGKNLKGIQVSGFLNIAREVEGLQLSFINIADTIKSGVPIGFLSIVKRGGLMQLELAGSSALHTAASFRIGLPCFYNIFSFGARPFADDKLNGFGYGLGTRVPFGNATAMEIELHSTQLLENWYRNNEEINLLNELRINLGVRLGQSLELFAGAALLNQIYKTDLTVNNTGRDISPDRLIHEHSWEGHESKWWVGFRGGLRIHIR